MTATPPPTPPAPAPGRPDPGADPARSGLPAPPAAAAFAPGAGVSAGATSVGLLRTAWRLFTQHWWELIAVAALALVAHHYLIQLAILLGRAGAVPGMLVFALVPFSPLVGLVAMLLVLRRRQGVRGLEGLMGAVGSVLIPFLVVYESTGALLRDLGAFFYLGLQSDMAQLGSADGSLDDLSAALDAFDGTYRVPDPTSPIVLGVVVAAVLLRFVGGRFLAADGLRTGRPGWPRSVLQVLVGYTEIIWIVLGAMVLRSVVGASQEWLLERRVGNGAATWWEGFTLDQPELAAIAAGVVLVVLTISDGAVTGLVVPIAWLSIGVIVYGLQVADTVSDDDVVKAVRRPTRLGQVADRVSPGVVTLAWRRISDPDGRFGALLGGLALILRAGFAPVLLFCLVYVLINQLLPYLLWGLARLVVPAETTQAGWAALHDPIDAVASFLTLALSAVLVAVFADALLAHYGATTALRIAPPRRTPATGGDDTAGAGGSSDDEQPDRRTDAVGGAAAGAGAAPGDQGMSSRT